MTGEVAGDKTRHDSVEGGPTVQTHVSGQEKAPEGTSRHDIDNLSPHNISLADPTKPFRSLFEPSGNLDASPGGIRH